MVTEVGLVVWALAPGAEKDYTHEYTWEAEEHPYWK